MGAVQEVADTPQSALDKAIEIANKVAACAPLGIETALASAHLAINNLEANALSKLDSQYGALTTPKTFWRAERPKQKAGHPFTKVSRTRFEIRLSVALPALPLSRTSPLFFKEMATQDDLVGDGYCGCCRLFRDAMRHHATGLPAAPTQRLITAGDPSAGVARFGVLQATPDRACVD
jgi:hypothetical protein